MRTADISPWSPCQHHMLTGEARGVQGEEHGPRSPQAPVLYLTLKLHPSISLHGSLGSSLVIKACSSKYNGRCLLSLGMNCPTCELVHTC